jgi:hypothetical protein
MGSLNLGVYGWGEDDWYACEGHEFVKEFEEMTTLGAWKLRTHNELMCQADYPSICIHPFNPYLPTFTVPKTQTTRLITSSRGR